MRLDHLLSKEHHETARRPQMVGVRIVQRFVGWAAPVVGVGSGAQQTRRFSGVVLLWGARAGGKSSDTLLGFETTSPLFRVCGSERRVVALLWWWGVVFDLWIVVASI